MEAGRVEDVVLKVGSADLLESATDYARRHPEFKGRLDIQARTVPRDASEVPVRLRVIFEVAAPGEVSCVFVQFAQWDAERIKQGRELSAVRRGA